MTKSLVFSIFFLLLVGFSLGHQAVSIKDVTSLVLQKGAYTTSHRFSPVPHLKCIGGTAASEAYRVDTIHCRQIGFDGFDATWECSAELDQDIRLGMINVVCESFNYPDDEYIVAGSCYAEYELNYTWKPRPHYELEPVVETVVEETVVQHGYDYGYGYDRPTTVIYEEIDVGPYSEPHLIVVEDIEYSNGQVLFSIFLLLLIIGFFTCVI